MVYEAVTHYGGEVMYSDIRKYIKNKYGEKINPVTIDDQIQIITVNHKSRINYPQNNKPRLTNTASQYDLLFTTSRGKVVKYNIERHGVWEIYNNYEGKLKIRKVEDSFTNKIYTPNDIIWFKNVTNKNIGQAYLNITEDFFVLHFPTSKGNNVKSPQPGEIILLYQKINEEQVFTHLVTPIDNIIIDSQRESYRYGRNVKIIAKTTAEDSILVKSTLWRNKNLGGITQGNACKLDEMTGITDIDELRLDTWNNFVPYFVHTEIASAEITDSIISELRITNEELSVKEGALKLISHLVKERNKEIVFQKKQIAIQNKKLHCEVCTFSFKEIYGATYIECHHLDPIGKGGIRQTTLADLALVCSNCHRMLHTKFDGKYLSIQQLQEKIHSYK